MTNLQTPMPQPQPKSESGGNFRFRLDDEVRRRIEFLVREGIKALPHRGLEIGGLLLGGSEDAGDSLLTVTDIVPLDIEHRFGPAFRPSENDRKVFLEALEQHGADPNARVVGYYRSQLVEAAAIRPEDHQVLDWLLHGKRSWLLLIEAPKNEASFANIYSRTAEGTLSRVHRSALLPDSPEKTEAAGAVPQIEETKPEAPREIRPAAVSGATAQEGGTKSAAASAAAGWSGWRRKAILAGAALVILVVAFALGRLGGPRGVSGSGPVGLRIEDGGSSIKIRWNAASDAIRNGSSGSLMVIDDTAVTHIDLKNEQLRQGTLGFNPQHANVTVLLTVYEKSGGFLAESQNLIRKLPGVGAPHPTETADVLPPPDFSRMAKVAAPPVAPPGRAPTVTPPTTQTTPARPAPIRTSTPVATSPAGERGQRGSTTSAARVSRPAQKAGGVVEPRAGEASLQTTALAETPPELSTGATTPIPAAVLTNPLTVPGHSEPVALKPVSFVAAMPLKRVIPTMPSGARSWLRDKSPVKVSVKVEVAADGRVRRASLAKSDSIAETMLAPSALQAARLWHFQPATRDGVPVVSETVLVFEFAK